VEKSTELFKLYVTIDIGIHALEEFLNFYVFDAVVATLQQVADFTKVQDAVAILVMVSKLPSFLGRTLQQPRGSSREAFPR